MSKNESDIYTDADDALKQAVVDKDMTWFRDILKARDFTPEGVNRALYHAASYGLQDFCDELMDNTNRQTYLDGCLICAITYKKSDLYIRAIENGADIHHKDEIALKIAIGFLHDDYAIDLVERGADIDVAFPPENTQALFRRVADGNAAKKTLSLLSILRAHAGDTQAAQPRYTFRLG